MLERPAMGITVRRSIPARSNLVMQVLLNCAMKTDPHLVEPEPPLSYRMVKHVFLRTKTSVPGRGIRSSRETSSFGMGINLSSDPSARVRNESRTRLLNISQAIVHSSHGHSTPHRSTASRSNTKASTSRHGRCSPTSFPALWSQPDGCNNERGKSETVSSLSSTAPFKLNS